MRTIVLLIIAAALSACSGHRKMTGTQTLEAAAVSADSVAVARSVAAVIERLSITSARIDSLTVTLTAPDGSSATVSAPRVSFRRTDSVVTAVSDTLASTVTAVRAIDAEAGTRTSTDTAAGTPGGTFCLLMVLLAVAVAVIVRLKTG